MSFGRCSDSLVVMTRRKIRVFDGQLKLRQRLIQLALSRLNLSICHQGVQRVLWGRLKTAFCRLSQIPHENHVFWLEGSQPPSPPRTIHGRGSPSQFWFSQAQQRGSMGAGCPTFQGSPCHPFRMVVLMARAKYGMEPCTCSWAPQQLQKPLPLQCPVKAFKQCFMSGSHKTLQQRDS